MECRAFENWLVRTGYEEMPGLEKVFIENGMDIGFWGHEHSYERFYPVANRTVYINGKNPYYNAPAPTYIISGSAGCHTPKASFGPPNPASAFR
uniref:Iron/zinc purple acid phosphatase-like C-terminal domain-containing protein n=1 Tax=Panagrolaimus superbus TaxID=310955 RepID=A0A914Z303_9BILA